MLAVAGDTLVRVSPQIQQETDRKMKNADPLEVSQASVEALDHIDHGFIRDALASLERPPKDVAGRLLRAELLLYLDRVDEAAAEVDAVAPALDAHAAEPTAVGACARRRHLLAAEVAYFRGQYDEASRVVDGVAVASEAAGDDQHAMRAAYDAGRILRRRGEYATSLETLLVASHMAQRLENAYYAGLVGYNRAICCYELGDYERLNVYLSEARERLQSTEQLRYFALCENMRGLVLTETGDVAAGMRVFAEAERIAGSLGVQSDLLSIASNAARALIGTGRFDEAEAQLTGLVDTANPERLTMAEFYPLCLVSIAQCARGAVRESHRSAQLALTIAEASGGADDRFEARLLVLRARGLSGEDAAVEAMREMLKEADARGTEYERAQVRIYLAHVLLAESPIEATTLCRDARAMGVLAPGHWLTTELERVEYLLARAPIRVDENDRLIIDTNMSWPTIKAAREATERFIYERAMSATNGNASAAGRLIGESRYQMHHLGRILRGEAPRPSRSKDPEAKDRKPIRRRSRISFG
jgi:tetratricopeptide (TPR) repeat protein